MNSRRLATAISAAVILLVLPIVGCSKNKNVQPAPPQEVARAVTPLAPRPEPPPAPAPKPAAPDIWSSDLATLNDYLRREGLLGDVYFAYDRSDLAAEARDRLSRNAQLLQQRPELVVSVEGHCDERGTAEYNLALGDRRSHSALGFVQNAGVSGSRLKSLSYGNERPVCQDSDESCWSRNRRATFIVVGRI